jgi:hypothetical protein
MQIVRHGDKSLLDKIKKFECNECKCIFLANRSEYELCGMHYNIQHFACKCPTCGTIVWRDE